MGCTQTKEAKVTANSQKQPEFTSLNGNSGPIGKINPQCIYFYLSYIILANQVPQKQYVGQAFNPQLQNTQNLNQSQSNNKPLQQQQQSLNNTKLGVIKQNNSQRFQDSLGEEYDDEYDDQTSSLAASKGKRSINNGNNTFHTNANGENRSAGSPQHQNTQKQLNKIDKNNSPFSNQRSPSNKGEDIYPSYDLNLKQQEFKQNLQSLKSGFSNPNYNDSNGNKQLLIGRFEDGQQLNQIPYAEKQKSQSNQPQLQQVNTSSQYQPLQTSPRAQLTTEDDLQKELSSAIDAYQRQIKDFKNSLTDMDKKFQNVNVPHKNNNNNPNNVKDNIQLIQPLISQNINNSNTVQSFITQQQPNTITQTVTQQSYNQYQQPTTSIKDEVFKNPNPVIQLQKNTTNPDKQQELPSKLSLNPNIATMNDKFEDDDLAYKNKYYNFEHQNSQNYSEGQLNPNKKPDQQLSLQGFQNQQFQTTPVTQQHTLNKLQTIQKDSLLEESKDLTNKARSKPSIHYDQLQNLKEQFLEQEERDRLNPQNILLRILFVQASNDSLGYDNDTIPKERKLYSFFVNKNGNIIDLKNRIRKEFGFDVEQLHIYFRYKELKNIQYILEIERYDVEEDILVCIALNSPKTQLLVVLREPLDDIKIADVRFLNCKDRSENGPKGNQFDFPSLIDMSKFNVDQDKLPWPIYRDWTAEAAYLSDIIIKNKNQLLVSNEQQFLFQQGFTKDLINSPQLAELVEAETQYRRLAEEFRRASLYAVHLVVQKNPTPLNLFNLYGDDGDKYILGGILIRRAKDWSICGHQLSENAQLTINASENGGSGESGQALLQISGKIASLDVRNLALLRNRIDQLVVPLACIVDYYGLRFETQSLAPISINSLAYGSDMDDLLFTDNDQEAEMMSRQIAQTLNLKVHFMEEQATKKIKRCYLPYTVQLHRNKDMGDTDKKFYLINAFRLFPQDDSLKQQSQPSSFLELLAKQLRPELVINNNKGDPAPDFDFYSWKNPTKCDECGELLPTEKFKYPVNKIVLKELPVKDRLQYWQNRITGNKYYELQYRKVPLNSDAHLAIINTKDKQERISDQEEILRAGQKIKDEILSKLIEEFNNVDEDPLSSDQFDKIIHSRGIAIRHLGKICTNAQLNHIREMAVIEVIARSAKTLIRDGLTFLADDEEAGFRSETIKKCVLHYLTEIFNFDDKYQAASSQNIWDFITEHARKKYQVSIEKDVLHKIHLPSLLQSICSKLNINLIKQIKDINFNLTPHQGEANQESILTLADIETISPVVKDYEEQMMTEIALMAPQDKFPCSLTMITESARMKDAEGKRSQWFMIGGDERVEATEIYKMASNVCEQIYGGQQNIHYARVLKEFAEHLESRHQERGRPENSRWNRNFAVPEDELSMESRYFYQNALQILKDIGQELSIETAEIQIALARLFKPRAAEYSHYRDLDNNIADMYKSLAQAIDIYETLLGFDHPETADAYTKMALAYQEQGNFQAASPWIRRAFTVFFKCFGSHDQITLNCWEYLKAIESNIDSKLDQAPYEELPLIIFELEKRQRMIEEQQRIMVTANGGSQLQINAGRLNQYPQVAAAYQKSIVKNNQQLMLRN